MVLLYSFALLAFWLLLSGHFDPLLVGLGIASVALTMFFVLRMRILDKESFPFHLTLQLPRFFVYITNEIIKSNIDVLGRILSFRTNAVSPQLRELPLPQNSDLGRVIYANSITLTPGTVSLELKSDSVVVHALTKQAAEGLASGEMAQAIPDGGAKQ